MIVRQLVRLLPALVFILSACATPEGAKKEGQGPEETSGRPRDARGNERVPETRQPTEDELAAAFEEDATSDAPEPASTASKGASSAPAAVDPLAEQKRQFEAAAQEAKQAIAAKAPEAQAKADLLSNLATPLGPAWIIRAWQLRAGAAMALDDAQLAFDHARRLLGSCGPEKVEGCRGEALALMQKSAPRTKHPAKSKALLADLKEADACVKAAESAGRKGAPMPPCAELARRAYRSQKDALMLTRLAVADAHGALKDPKTSDKGLRSLEKAESLCGDARCVEVRRRALKLQLDAQLAKQDFQAAARAALRDMQLHATTLAPAERPWAWTEAMDRACAALDKAEGDGACRKLEQRQGASLTFKDFSKSSAGDALGADAVRMVNAHYAVTFQECLAAEAQRLTETREVRSSQSYRVRWVVQNDGRAGELHMERKEEEDGPLAQCLRRKLGLWRYPRYDGELQHVEQTFVVSATSRR